MSYFTRQFSPNGPVLTALVGVSQARKNSLEGSGLPVPAPSQILGLVDTGASCTCIDPLIIKALGLTSKGSIPVDTPSTGTTPILADQYDVSLSIWATTTHPPLVINNLAVICSELHARQGIHALIGRDILCQCLMTYDGVNGFFSLAY